MRLEGYWEYGNGSEQEKRRVVLALESHRLASQWVWACEDTIRDLLMPDGNIESKSTQVYNVKKSKLNDQATMLSTAGHNKQGSTRSSKVVL